MTHSEARKRAAEMLAGAGEKFDEADVMAGLITPVFFGSAMNNFGVQMLLDRFLTLAPQPVARNGGARTKEGKGADPAEDRFPVAHDFGKVAEVGGELRVRSAPGHGTTVRLEVGLP